MKPYLMILTGLLLGGCALRPEGEWEERERSRRAIEESGELPVLSEQSGPEDYLRMAFLMNAELESRYWEWRAAIEEIPQASSWPNPAVSFGYMFRPDTMKSWDRTTLGISNDGMSNIPFPTKLSAAGRRALEDARAAGLRFEEAKFLLQGRVLSAYYDLALLAETIRIQNDTVELLRQILSQTEVRVRVGGATQQDLLSTQTEMDLAKNDLENLKNQVPPLAARLNALLGRPATESVPLPAKLPVPRPLSISDGDLLRVAAERSPGLAARIREIAGREEALGLARQAYIPDFALSFNLTGNATRMAESMLTIPLRVEAIRAGVEQARANLKAVQAARVQYERDLAASFVFNLYVFRNDERQISLFENSILSRARQTVEMIQTSHAAGRASFTDLLSAQRAYLDARLALAQLKMEREKALAAIETWSAVDVEMMSSARRPLRAMGTAGRQPPAGGGSGGGNPPAGMDPMK